MLRRPGRAEVPPQPNYPFPTLSIRIPLPQALEKIAVFLGLDATLLNSYAEEDTIGGYHHDPEQRRKTETGELAKGIWGVEGQVVYALLRALRPKHTLEVGRGTSTLHIGEAVRRNGTGKVTTLDLPEKDKPEERRGGCIPSEYGDFMVEVHEDLREFNYRTRPLLDFVFEDSFHTPELVGHVWSEFAKKARSGAVIVSHDSEHFRVGYPVREGIEQVVPEGEYLSIAIAPADCGLAIWRKD